MTTRLFIVILTLIVLVGCGDGATDGVYRVEQSSKPAEGIQANSANPGSEDGKEGQKKLEKDLRCSPQICDEAKQTLAEATKIANEMPASCNSEDLKKSLESQAAALAKECSGLPRIVQSFGKLLKGRVPNAMAAPCAAINGISHSIQNVKNSVVSKCQKPKQEDEQE